MTLKELAHLAQQTLHTRAGCPVRRSHVHEFLAAAFGHRSWAAFLSDSVLADSGVGAAPTSGLPDLIGRAVQLGYEQQAAGTVATTLQAFIAEHRLSAVSLADLRAALLPTAQVADRDDLDDDDNCIDDDDDDDDDEGWDDEPPRAAAPASGPAREQLMGSPMLLSSLEQAAGPANPQGHFLLAALYRCGRPNPYLYEESLKGRVLTAIERGWVDDYLRLEPQYWKYEAHLKAAALGGVRAAALEYGTAFENPEFIALAERLTGEIDALKMARHASSDEARARWLRAAAEQGSRTAMEAQGQHDSQWAAMESIAAKIGCTAETLRRWVRQHERDSGQRDGTTTAEAQRIKDLERENRELRKANEILKLVSAFFAQAELDRRLK